MQLVQAVVHLFIIIVIVVVVVFKLGVIFLLWQFDDYTKGNLRIESLMSEPRRLAVEEFIRTIYRITELYARHIVNPPMALKSRTPSYVEIAASVYIIVMQILQLFGKAKGVVCASSSKKPKLYQGMGTIPAKE